MPICSGANLISDLKPGGVAGHPIWVGANAEPRRVSAAHGPKPMVATTSRLAVGPSLLPDSRGAQLPCPTHAQKLVVARRTPECKAVVLDLFANDGFGSVGGATNGQIPRKCSSKALCCRGWY